MSEYFELSPRNLSESQISKIIGLTVDVKMKYSDEIIEGVIFSLIKANNMLILLKKDDADQISSYIINLEYLSDIKVSNSNIEVDFQELMNPNLDKILENERKNVEKDSLLKKSEKDKDNAESQKIYQQGFAIYEKLSKL